MFPTSFVEALSFCIFRVLKVSFFFFSFVAVCCVIGILEKCTSFTTYSVFSIHEGGRYKTYFSNKYIHETETVDSGCKATLVKLEPWLWAHI